MDYQMFSEYMENEVNETVYKTKYLKTSQLVRTFLSKRYTT